MSLSGTESFGSISESNSAGAYEGQAGQLASYLQAQWVVCGSETAGAVLAFRGLRVRIGFHATLDTKTSVNQNQTNKRYIYTGMCVLHACMAWYGMV